MKIECRNCKSKNLFVEIEGTRRGLYCGDCGKWQKWITKQELRVCELNNIKTKDIKDKIIQNYKEQLVNKSEKEEMRENILKYLIITITEGNGKIMLESSNIDFNKLKNLELTMEKDKITNKWIMVKIIESEKERKKDERYKI